MLKLPPPFDVSTPPISLAREARPTSGAEGAAKGAGQEGAGGTMWVRRAPPGDVTPHDVLCRKGQAIVDFESRHRQRSLAQASTPSQTPRPGATPVPGERFRALAQPAWQTD